MSRDSRGKASRAVPPAALVVRALDVRAAELRRAGRAVPPPLRQSIGSFRKELAAVRRELGGS